MGQKTKFIILGLIGIFAISLFLNLQLYRAKQVIVRERDDLKSENATLAKKINETNEINRRNQDKISALNRDLERINAEKEDIQHKLELLSKERDALIERIKVKTPEEVRRPPSEITTLEAVKPTPPSEDAYWADLLKIKADLELQLTNIRKELSNIKINNEQLQREKTTLELDINNLNRENQDLKRQLEYNQKMMDSIAQELVRERNDKFQIRTTLKPIQNENYILRRQLKSLNDRKINLERKLTELRGKNITLENRLTEMDTMLKDYLFQIERLKKQLGQGQSQQEQVSQISSAQKQASVELPPIVVRPQTGMDILESISSEGKVLGVNKENNFVIIDLGESAGLKAGDTLNVYREGNRIASIEVIQVRKNVSACDIKQERIPIKIGDTVR